MQTCVEILARRYCDKVEHRLKGWVRRSTITETVWECMDSICTNPELCDSDLPPAALWRKIVERFGQPHDFAMLVLERHKKLARHRFCWRCVRHLAIIGLVTVLTACTFHFYLNDTLWASPNELTDPNDRLAALSRLQRVFDNYRKLEQCSLQLQVNSRVYGRERKAKYRVLHKENATIFRPITTDVPHISFSDSATVMYYPGLQAYETFPGVELNRTIGGQSLVVGLLQNSLGAVQTEIQESDIHSIAATDTEICFELTGVYFGWGDARFTIVTDAHTGKLKRFSVERLDETGGNKSFLYSETVVDQAIVPVPPEATVLSLPGRARQTSNLLEYFYHAEQGWKARRLIGKQAPLFRGTDVRSNRSFDLAQHRGKPVLLVCCASWVPQHRFYLSALAEIYPLLANMEVEVVAIAPDVEKEITRDFLALSPLPFPYITDYSGWQNPAFSNYDLYARYDYTPSFICIGSDGNVKSVLSQYLSPRTHSLQDIINLTDGLLSPAQRQAVFQCWREPLAQRTAAELLDEAERRFRHGNDYAGKALLEEILRRDPGALSARLKLCELYAAYDSAQGLAVAESCLNDTNASPYPYLVLGDHYRFNKNDNDRAEHEYRKAFNLDRRCWLAKSKLGDLCFARSDYQGAYSRYAEALTLAPDNSLLLYKVGLAAYYLDDYSRARECLDHALRRPNYWRGAHDEHMIYARRVFADVLQSLSLHDDAITVLEIALRYDQGYDGVLCDLCELLLQHTDRHGQVIAFSRRLLDGNPNGKYYLLHSKALSAIGHRSEAEEALKMALLLDPTLAR